MNKEPSAIKKTFGDFAPKLVQLTDDVLFGDVWERPELSKRDRSLVTVTAQPVLPLFSLLPGKLREFAMGGALVLEKEPLSLAIDFVAIQIVLVRPVSVVRDDAQLPP